MYFCECVGTELSVIYDLRRVWLYQEQIARPRWWSSWPRGLVVIVQPTSVHASKTVKYVDETAVRLLEFDAGRMGVTRRVSVIDRPHAVCGAPGLHAPPTLS